MLTGEIGGKRVKGSEEWLVRYMEGASKHFVIPVYQRNYDWKTEQCKQLYDDLVRVIRQERKSHFFGSIVSVSDPDGKMLDFLIIDGQQRLTTVSLLLLAMYNLMQEGIVTPEVSNLSQRIYEEYLVDKWQPEEKRIKLKPIKNDREAFGRLFSATDEHVADSNLTINYRYFYQRIQRQEISVDELFEAISRLEIINILLNHEDNPQLIFESLNSTGLDLSEGDKIRNYVLMGLPGKEQEVYYEKYWNKIEVCTGYDVSSFIRDYLSIRQQSTPAIKHVYVKFKEYVEDSKKDTEALLQDLLDYAKRYETLLKGNSPYEAVNDCIYRLNRLKTTVTRPFLMEALRMHQEGHISENDLTEIFRIIEVYVFRRNICDLPTNALNKIFLMLHREIIRLDGTEENYMDKFKYILLSKKESGTFPDDEEFAEKLSTKNVYAMRGESKYYLFERLENAGTVETKDVWRHLDKGHYSIEHIMPQTLSPAWMRELGPDYEQIHSLWLHRLANLTLTGYNSQYRNAPFREKRDMEHGFKSSGLRMNQWIWQQDNWGEKELEARNDLLIQQALSIWPFPETDYQPQEKQLDFVTLEEDTVLTGKLISKFSFRGMEHPVNSWVDMYQQVLMMLHSEDKSILTKLAVSQNPNMELAGHFSTEKDTFESCRAIDQNLFVWTGTDTQYKINVLKKLFPMFDVDPSELVMFLREEGESEENELSRYQIRRRYWAYLLPKLRERSGIYQNVNPSKMNWITGSLGYSGANINCIANFNGARVELYLGSADKERNKKLYDFLYAYRDEIEKQLTFKVIWSRADDLKASRIYAAVDDLDVSNENDWPRMAEFHAKSAAEMRKAFSPILEKYFQKV